MPKKLTDAEQIEKRKTGMKRQFDRRDADQDGKLSAKEFMNPASGKKNARKPKQKDKNVNAEKKAKTKKQAAAS